MINRAHSTNVNHTTYKRKIFCDKCGRLVTHEGVIDLVENGNGLDMWSATYYCERQSCQKEHPNCNCKYTETQCNTRPPIMNKYEFKRKMKKLDTSEGFVIDD